MRWPITLFLILGISALVSASAAAADDKERGLSPTEAAGRPVSEIRIEGLKRTESFVVRRELLVAKGVPLVPADLAESVQRLKNLRIFSSVVPRLSDGPDASVVLTLKVREKWTILPFLRFGGGGGTNFLIAGLYDINLLGRYLELGGQYENLNGAHSGVAWFRDPRFLGERLLFGIDLWKVNRIRDLYYRDGRRQGAYNMGRNKVNSMLELELHSHFRVGVGVELDDDSFSEDSLTSAQREANLTAGLRLPADGLAVIGRANALLGRLDYDDWHVEGATLGAVVEHASGLWGSDFDFTRLTLQGIGFVRLPLDSNAGFRLTVGHTDTTALQHLFYIGGLEYKRGFKDGQFRGQEFWDANFEYRIPSLQTSWLVLQHVVFYDVGHVMEDWGEAFDGAPCMSTGLGVRLVSPRIARLVLRLDYAFAFGEHDEHGISFGVQQFF